MEEGHIRYQVQRALNLWQAASRLTFTEVNRDDADIRVSFHSLVSDYFNKPVNQKTRTKETLFSHFNKQRIPQ